MTYPDFPNRPEAALLKDVQCGQIELLTVAAGKWQPRHPRWSGMPVHGQHESEMNRQPFPVGVRRDFLLGIIDNCIRGIISFTGDGDPSHCRRVMDRWVTVRGMVAEGWYDQHEGQHIYNSALRFWYHRERRNELVLPQFNSDDVHIGARPIYYDETDYNNYTRSRFSKMLQEQLEKRIKLYERIIALLKYWEEKTGSWGVRWEQGELLAGLFELDC